MTQRSVAGEGRGGTRVRARRLAVLALLPVMLAPGACTVVQGGAPEPLDAMSVGSLIETSAPATPSGSAIFIAAHRSLALERSEWRDDASGAWGTVRRTGPDDGQACTPAELTVHDYRGARVESRLLCPVPGASMIP